MSTLAIVLISVYFAVMLTIIAFRWAIGTLNAGSFVSAVIWPLTFSVAVIILAAILSVVLIMLAFVLVCIPFAIPILILCKIFD